MKHLNNVINGVLITINTINKAHTLIVQTIHDEYETLGKEYEVYVQKEMAHIHIDQNELMRMKKRKSWYTFIIIIYSCIRYSKFN